MAGEMILIVEDEELIALEMKNSVSSWGFNAVTVRSGEEALRISGGTPPPLALMDIKLKGSLDGIETASLLRERHGTAVIFITAYSNMEIIDRAKHSMPFGFLVKPVQDRELRASIETALYMHDVEAARCRAEQDLREAHRDLEKRVEERTRELKKSNEDLLKSEERYRALFENASVGIGIALCDGTVLASNPAMTDLLGYNRDDLVSLNVRELYVDPADREQVLAMLKKHGYVKDFEVPLRHKNGSEVHVSINISGITWENRKALHTIMEDVTERKQALDALIQAHAELDRRVAERTAELAGVNRVLEAEIDERKRAEESLRESEEKYRLLVESINEGIWYIDGDANTVFVNRRMADMMGYSVDEMTGRHLFSFMDDQGVALAKKNIERRKQGVCEQHDFEFIRKDGTRIYTLLGTSPISDAGGGYKGAVAGVADVTERRRAELAMYEMKERLEMTQEAAGVGSWDWNVVSGRIVWSQKMFELFGLDSNATEASFDAWRSVLHPNDLSTAEERITRALETRTELDNEYRVILADGSTRWISARGKGVYDDRGRPLRMGGICIDITRRKQMQEMVRISEEKFSKAFMASPEAISITTMDQGVYVEVNDAFLARTGFNRDEVIGRTSAEIKVWVGAEDRSRYVNELTTAGRLRDFEVRYRMKDGEIRDFLVSSEIINISGKQCSLNHIIDITDRKRMEAILRQEHDNFLKVFASAPVGLLLLDADTMVTDANSYIGAIVLREPAEIIGARGGGAIGCVHSLEDPRGCGFSASCPECPLRRGIKGVLTGGTSLRNAEINLSLIINGVPRERWLSVSADAVTLKGKRGIIVAIADISDMKQKEIEVLESRANLRALIDNTDDIIVSRDPEGRALVYNTNFERVVRRLFGVAAFPGINTLEYLPDKLKMHWKEILARVMKGQPCREEYSWDFGNGDVHYYDSSMNPIHLDNRIVGVTELIRDITERKRVEETRNRLIFKLESLWGLSKQQDQDFKLLTDFILEEMMKLTESRYAFYGLINDDESEMKVYSWSRGAMAQCAMDNLPLVFNISGSGIWADAVRGRQAVVVNDYEGDFAGKHGLPEGHVPLTRLVSVPVFRSGKIVAVGAVANKISDYIGEDIKAIEEFLTNANIIVERKRAEDLLRISEERYRTVADFTFDWEFWTGPGGGFLYISPSCERITGYTSVEFIADPNLMQSIVHPDDKARVRGHFADPDDESCELHGLDFRIVRKDGKVRWIGHRCQVVYGHDGRKLGRRGSHREITERKRAEEEVLRLNRHIITLQEQERQRVAKDLHDGVSQLMNAAKLNFAAFSQDAEKNRERFDTGMEFIDLASRELREVYSNLYPAALEDLGLAAAVRLYTKNFLANRGIDAEVTIDDELRLPIEVQIDLYRIIQESCSNIARHSGATLARLGLKEQEGLFTLMIYDNGAGFDPGAPRSSEGGFGIINMKQRVKHLNGTFELETGSSGTRITITITSGDGSNG